jgi:glutaredoxin
MPRNGLLLYVDKGEESLKVMEHLRKSKCQFMTRDITESGMAEMELDTVFGNTQVPVVVWEGHTVRGFDPDALDQLISRDSS